MSLEKAIEAALLKALVGMPAGRLVQDQAKDLAKATIRVLENSECSTAAEIEEVWNGTLQTCEGYCQKNWSFE